MQFTVTPMTDTAARAIVQWRYAEPYALYNMGGSDEAAGVRYLLDGVNDYHAIHNEMGELVGFCCFGREAQVPGGDYAAAALDVGLGMRPDLTGQGLGTALLTAILEFAAQEIDPARWRATVASFNIRSQRIFTKAGFQPVQTFLSRSEAPLAFVVVTKELVSSKQYN